MSLAAKFPMAVLARVLGEPRRWARGVFPGWP